MLNNYSVIDPLFYLSDIYSVGFRECVYSRVPILGNNLENYSTVEPYPDFNYLNMHIWFQFFMKIEY